MGEQQGFLCAGCYLTLATAGFNPCDQSAPSCPPPDPAAATDTDAGGAADE